MESLLPQIQVAPAPQPAPAPPLNIAADPRFIEIQKEMLLLQQDLLAARGLKDPESGSLQAELASTQADNAKLNEEFKNAMEDFGRIKEQLSILEDENQRLQTEGLSEARTKAEQDLLALQTKIGDLSSENSNLRVQLGERENRISGLRDELARAQVKIPGVAPDNAALRAQIIRLEGSSGFSGQQSAKEKWITKEPKAICRRPTRGSLPLSQASDRRNPWLETPQGCQAWLLPSCSCFSIGRNSEQCPNCGTQ